MHHKSSWFHDPFPNYIDEGTVMHMDLWFNVNPSDHSTQSIHITVLLCTFSVHISARLWVAIVHTEKKSGTTRD